MVSSIVVNCYTFQIEAGNDTISVTVHGFYTIGSLKWFCWSLFFPSFFFWFVFFWSLFFPSFFFWFVDHCFFLPIADLVLDGERTALNLDGSSLNVPPGLSLITSAFVCTLPAWPMGACAFYLSCLGFLIVGVEFISISILNLFLVSIGVFSFSFDLEVDLYQLFVACVSFFGRICCFIFCWVVFGIYFFIVFFGIFWFLFWCGWLFHQNPLWFVSLCLLLNLLDNGVGSFINVFV